MVECFPKPFFSIFYLTDLSTESFGHAAQQLKSIDDSHEDSCVVANYVRLLVKINAHPYAQNLLSYRNFTYL